MKLLKGGQVEPANVAKIDIFNIKIEKLTFFYSIT